MQLRHVTKSHKTFCNFWKLKMIRNSGRGDRGGRSGHGKDQQQGRSNNRRQTTNAQ